MTSLVRLWSQEDGAVKVHRHWITLSLVFSLFRPLSSFSNPQPPSHSLLCNHTDSTSHQDYDYCGNRDPEVTAQGSQVRVQGGSLGWGIVRRSLSHISVCCSLIPTALYYNAQMDADMEPSKSVLGTVPARNLSVWQCVCGLQWLHSRATCRHHELLQTWAPHQELRLHGGRRCAYPTAV